MVKCRNGSRISVKCRNASSKLKNSSEMDLKNKVAFITGAAQGLGKAYAEALLEKGAKVFLGDVNPSVGSATYNELSQKYGSQNVRFSPFDVTDLAKFTEAFKQAVSDFGHVDIMVNNAGVMNEGIWELMIQINFTALVHGTRLATEHMRKDKGGQGGRIINISSIAGITDFACLPVYCGTKHAVRTFTSSMAQQPNIKELGVDYGIICPAAASTDLILKADDQKILFYDTVKNLIDNSAMPVATVVEAFMEIVQLENMNGSMLKVEKTGRRYVKMECVDVDASAE